MPVAGAGALFRAYPAARRGWALGVRQMAVPLGGTVAALLLPVLESLGGVRLPFLVAAVAVGVSGAVFAALAGAIPSARGHQPGVPEDHSRARDGAAPRGRLAVHRRAARRAHLRCPGGTRGRPLVVHRLGDLLHDHRHGDGCTARVGRCRRPGGRDAGARGHSSRSGWSPPPAACCSHWRSIPARSRSLPQRSSWASARSGGTPSSTSAPASCTSPELAGARSRSR